MRNALITGAAGALGSSVASRLAGMGFRVIALDLDKEGLNRLSREISVETMAMDVTDINQLREASEILLNKYGGLDLLVCLAGVYRAFPVTEGFPEEFNRMMSVNFLSAANAIQAFTGQLAAKKGRVILVSSESYKIQAMFQPYMVSKAALEAYALSAWQELALKGICLSVVRPGAFRSGLLSWMEEDPRLEPGSLYGTEFRKSFLISKRMVGRIIPAEKVAKKIAGIAIKSRPGRVYRVNNNPLLTLITCIPSGLLSRIMVARFRVKKHR